MMSPGEIGCKALVSNFLAVIRGSCRTFAGVLCCLLCLQGMTLAQTPSDTSRTDRVHIIHSDIINGETIGDHDISYLVGDVQLSQDSVFIYCDSARLVDKREVAAFGNVIIQKGDSLHVFADTVLYFADTRLADLTGQVTLVHKTQQLWTTHLSYDMEHSVATYDRPAELIDSTTQLSSKRGIYWVDTRKALFLDSVVVIDPEFNLISDSLRYDVDAQQATFIAPTNIFQHGAEIYCESGYYDLHNHVAEFRDNATYRKGDQHGSADEIFYDGNVSTVRMCGNAQYTEKDQMASGDTIVYHENTGDTRIAGHAFYRDHTRQLHSPQAINYNRVSGEFSVEGRGVIAEGSRVVSADAMYRDTTAGDRLNLQGNVVIRDTLAQTILESDQAEILQENGFIKAYGIKRPAFKSVVDNDTLYVTQDTLKSYEVRDTITGDTVRYLSGYRDVRIFRGTLQGLCDSIGFMGRDSVFTMYGNPVLWSDTTQFTADTIDLYLRHKALDHVVLRSNGLIITAVQDAFYNQIHGRYIVAQIDSNTLRSLQVTGNAESIYYVQDDNNQAFVGVNRVVASEIFFTFMEGKLDKITFTTRPTRYNDSHGSGRSCTDAS